MKRHLTDEEKATIIDEFTKKLDDLTDCKVSFSKTVTMPKKVNIYYTPDAYSKTIRLIMAHSGEIAWHCLVRKVEDGYEVYDVLSYPQTVGAASVHVKMGRKFGDGKPKDPKKYYTDWYNEVVLSMPEEDEKNLCGQCHSHVNMGTTPSSVDLNQQKEELELKGGTGYYLFQIWNKSLDVNTFLYDLDNGVLYEKDDVNIVIEEDDLIKSSKEMLVEPEPVTVVKSSFAGKKAEENWDKNMDWEDWAMDGWNYPYSSYQRAPFQFYIAVEHDGELVDFIIEASSAIQAKRAFMNWAFDNVDVLSMSFNCDDAVFANYRIHEPVYSSGIEAADIPYEELIEYDYEPVEKL